MKIGDIGKRVFPGFVLTTRLWRSPGCVEHIWPRRTMTDADPVNRWDDVPVT